MAEKEKVGAKWKRKEGVEVAQPVGPHVRPVDRPPHQRSQVGEGMGSPLRVPILFTEMQMKPQLHLHF